MYLINVWKQRLKKFIDNPFAIFYFIRRNIYDRFVADRYVKVYKKLNILNAEDTLNYVIDNNKSIVRLGDGEFGLMRGASVYFNDWRQKYDKGLKEALIRVLSSHNQNILLCLPGEHLRMTKQDLRNIGKGSEYRFWINSKVLCHKYINMTQLYGSAFAFHPLFNSHIDYAKLKKYFSSKNIIIVTSNTQRFESIQLGKTTDTIESPKSDSWYEAENIKNKIFSHIQDKNYKKENVLLMISMGSAAKAVVYDLANMGYTAWDSGQFFDLAYKEISKIGN